MQHGHENVDAREAEHFAALAMRWWDPEGEMRTLHDINEPRTEFIAERAGLEDKKVLDVGCGGGLLSEALARHGALVTGIDIGERALEVARLHMLDSDLDIDYRQVTAEELAESESGVYDIGCCLQLLEHVPSPARTVEALAARCRPGGQDCIRTLNRTPLAWAAAIAGAEYLLGLIPRGTHRYDRLIKPSELAAACRRAGLDVVEITGMAYNPLSRTVRFGGPPAVNYFLCATRPEEA